MSRAQFIGTLPIRRTSETLLAALAPGELFVLSMALGAFLWAVIASQVLFPLYSNDHDEAVYVLQAQTLLEGKLTIPANDLSVFVRPWLTTISGDRIIFKYTPVHAAILAVGQLLFGSMRATLGIVAGLNIVLFYRFARELGLRKPIAVLSALLLLFSPLFLIQSATFLPYTTALLLHLAFAVLFLRGTRSGKPGLLVASGLVLGLDFFARPFDAVLVAIPFGLYLIAAHRKHLGQLAKPAAWIGLGFAPIFGLVLAHNAYLSGNPFVFPFSLLEPLDTLGFGPRRMFPGNAPILYDLPTALTALTSNTGLLNLWIPGGPILLGCVLLRWAVVKLRWQELLLTGLLLVFPLGYLFFWGSYNSTVLWKGASYLGPFYYLPTLVPIIILGLQGLVAIYRQSAPVAVGLITAAISVNAWLLTRPVLTNLAYTIKDQTIYRPLLDTSVGNAIVFVPPAYGPALLHPFAYLENSPSLNGRVIYALNLGSPNFNLMDAYPNRTVYRFDYLGQYSEELGSLAETRLTEIKRVDLPQLDQRLRLVNPGDAPYVFTYIWNGALKEEYLLDTASYRGRAYDVAWTITPTGIQFDGAFVRQLSSIGALSSDPYLAVAVAFGYSPDGTPQTVYERRFWLKLAGNGEIEVALPPEEWNNAEFPTRPFLQQDIEPVLTDR